jgi:hypothetical protein
MLRWIAILLMVALPLRSGLAAVQFCPWMAAAAAVAQTDTTQAASTEMDMGEDCPGASMVDGQCKLQTACSVTPVLRDAAAVDTPRISLTRPVLAAVYAAVVFPMLPDRVPIQRS